jgi:hypothetical protein
VTFHVEHGSNPYYLAVLVEYANGDGDVVQVDLMESRPDADGDVGLNAPVVGLHLAHGHAAPAARALLAAHHQRVRREARRRPGHPRRLAARRRLQLYRPVRLIN